MRGGAPGAGLAFPIPEAHAPPYDLPRSELWPFPPNLQGTGTRNPACIPQGGSLRRQVSGTMRSPNPIAGLSLAALIARGTFRDPAQQRYDGVYAKRILAIVASQMRGHKGT